MDIQEKEILKRTFKGSVFCNLFTEKKYLLQLYNVLHPEDGDVQEGDIDDVTILNVLTDDIYNDLGFSVRGKLIVLVEAQSTWSPNILLRFNSYLMKTYWDILEQTGQSIFGSKKVVLPVPEFYVVYTGKQRKGIQNRDKISLSKEFWDGEDAGIEIKAHILYNGEKNDILYQYVTFCHVADDMIRKYGRTEEAFSEIMRICKSRNILREYLTSMEKEVYNMIFCDPVEANENYVRSRIKEAVDENTIKVKIQSYNELGVSRPVIVDMVINTFGLTDDEAEEKVQEYLG